MFAANEESTWDKELPQFLQDNNNTYKVYSKKFPRLDWKCRTQ